MKKTSKLLILAGAIGTMAGVIAALKGGAGEEPRRKTWSEAQDAPETPDETDTSDEAEVAEKSNEADAAPTLVKVLPTGPRTAAVRPTEEEEKELLRQRLEKTIRF